MKAHKKKNQTSFRLKVLKQFFFSRRNFYLYTGNNSSPTVTLIQTYDDKT